MSIGLISSTSCSPVDQPKPKQADLDVQLDDSRTLKISALRREAASGRTVAAISRNTILPKHADPLEVEAHLDAGGQLTIQVMKVGEMLNRKRMRFG